MNAPIKLTAWSFSRFQTYEQCPLKAKFQFIDRLKTASSPALEKGLEFHNACESYLKGLVKTVPPLLKTFKKELTALRKNKCESEKEWTLTKDWRVTTWFSKDAWLRLKIDALERVNPTTLRVIDFKTGKVREEHENQLGLYALAAFMVEPHVNEVIAELWYFDSAHAASLTFMREELDQLREDWLDATQAMLNDENFVATPNRYCNWCDFGQGATGPHKGLCKFG